MNKILLITTDFPPTRGGVASYWRGLLPYFNSDQTTVLAPAIEGAVNFDSVQPYKIVRKKLFTSLFWPRWLPMLWQTWKLVRTEKIDRIIAGQPLPGGTVALIVKMITGVPYILSFHGMDFLRAKAQPRKYWLLKKIMAEADGIIVNSHYTESLVAKDNVHNCPIVVAYPAASMLGPEVIDKEKAKSDLHFSGKKVVLSVGRLVERKGFDKTIMAINKLRSRYQDLVYVIVGNGVYLHRLQRLLVENCLQSVVSIVTQADDNDLQRYYSAADVFCLPVREIPGGDVEGFGIVYLEAGSYGLPVIAGNSGGAPEAVVDGATGIVVDGNSISSIAFAISQYLENDSLTKQHGMAGRWRAINEFKWQDQALKIQQVLSIK